MSRVTQLGFYSNDTLIVIERTREAIDAYSAHFHAADMIELQPEHVEALQDGKVLAWEDGEYCHFAMLEEEREENTIDYFCTACQKPFKGHVRIQAMSGGRTMIEIVATCPNCGDDVASGLEIVNRERANA